MHNAPLIGGGAGGHALLTHGALPTLTTASIAAGAVGAAKLAGKGLSALASRSPGVTNALVNQSTPMAVEVAKPIVPALVQQGVAAEEAYFPSRPQQ
jgi:hypothetical protein